jgi:hypothetical protein
MNDPISSNTTLSIVPLGAGDLIDRAVRFYRANFVVFVLIAAPPVVLGTICAVGWMMMSRWLFPGGAYTPTADVVLYYLFAWLGAVLIWIVEINVTLSVMGGASRNFVRHLLHGEPITFRETYRNAWSRASGLSGASLIITFLLGVVGGAISYFVLIIGSILAILAFGIFESLPEVGAILAILITLVTFVGSGLLFLLVASRLAYVPQIMLVEGLGVFASLGRSISLASGNFKRFAALVVFTVVAIYSALAILYIPLGWYAWSQGVEILSFEQETTPAWFEIASQLVSQASLILLLPIWMVGLCLLYVDERVRHEGYDIELMANRRLGEIPDVPDAYINPLNPALSDGRRVAPGTMPVRKDTSTLGLG